MTTMSPDDLAAMFDLPPQAEPPQSATSEAQAAAAAEAEEAALAAELAAAIESGGFAEDAPESRTNLRVEVSWPARMQLPDGNVVEVEVRNVSEGGVGLVSDEDIPARTVVDFEMAVPSLEAGGDIALVKGTLKTTYTVDDGSRVRCGGTWQVPPAGLQLVTLWIRRLQR